MLRIDELMIHYIWFVEKVEKQCRNFSFGLSFQLKGETENAKINFTDPVSISNDLPRFDRSKNLDLLTATINELKRIQLADGSFNLNQDLANLLAVDINDFEALKTHFSKQGFNSFGKTLSSSVKQPNNQLHLHLALNIQNEIIRLIATGIILMKLFFQIPVEERKTYLVPFDHEYIRVRRLIQSRFFFCLLDSLL